MFERAVIGNAREKKLRGITQRFDEDNATGMQPFCIPLCWRCVF
jgi:hypothetical protein